MKAIDHDIHRQDALEGQVVDGLCVGTVHNQGVFTEITKHITWHTCRMFLSQHAVALVVVLDTSANCVKLYKLLYLVMLIFLNDSKTRPRLLY